MPASSLDVRRVVVAGAAAAIVGGLLVAGGLIGRSDDSASTGATPTTAETASGVGAQPSDVDVAASDAAGTSVPAFGDGSSHGPDAATIPPEDLEAAKAVAAEFAVGFSTYRFDEPQDAPLDRVRHLLSAEVADVLGDNSGATAERERQADRREVAEATLDSVITAGFDADHVLLNVVVTQQVSSTEGAVDHVLAYQVSLKRSGDGWQITGVAIS